MNTRRNAARRLEEEMSNAGVTRRGDQVPPLGEDVNDDQVAVNPPPFMDKNIRLMYSKFPKALLPKHKSPLLKHKP